jgi:phage shock protein C
MATREQTRPAAESADMIAVNIRDQELQQTLYDFMVEDKEAPKQSILLNVANAVGIGMITAGTLYLLQYLGVPFIPDMSKFMGALPVLGGLFISLLGFGFFTYERNLRKAEKARRKSAPQAQVDPFATPLKTSASKTGSSSASGLGSPTTESWALKQRKRLYKSITDKKLFGVCAGLAKYLGVDATVIRFVFVLSAFLTSGSAVVVYLALAIALSKEPPELAGLGED